MSVPSSIGTVAHASAVLPSEGDGVNDDRHPVVRRLDAASDADLRADFVMAAYDENQRRLTSFAYALTRDADAADDLVQESFLRLVKEHAAGREPQNITAWLFRVCANLATSRGRRGVVARRYLERPSAEETESAAEVEVLRHEMSEALVAVLAILPADARMAVVMAAQGFSGREIADALGRTETSTRTMMFRAREQMRTFLEADGIRCECHRHGCQHRRARQVEGIPRARRWFKGAVDRGGLAAAGPLAAPSTSAP